MNIPHIPVGLSPLIFIDPVSVKETASINNYTWPVELLEIIPLWLTYLYFSMYKIIIMSLFLSSYRIYYMIKNEDSYNNALRYRGSKSQFARFIHMKAQKSRTKKPVNGHVPLHIFLLA